MSDPAQSLRDHRPSKPFLVGVDSDGCVFDNMTVKHQRCFGPQFVEHFRLSAIRPAALEIWDLVNLYSRTRGINRFTAVVTVLDRLARHPEVARQAVRLPDPEPLRHWIQSENKLSNASLTAAVERTGQAGLRTLLEWSLAVNESVRQLADGIPPFPHAETALRRAAREADVMVVSQGSGATIEREWRDSALVQYVTLLASQEMGGKADHLRLAAADRYPREHVLMVGDAPGDLEAARSNGVLFFPILPGHEDACWASLEAEGLPAFFAGRFAGEYQAGLLARFEQALPSLA